MAVNVEQEEATAAAERAETAAEDAAATQALSDLDDIEFVLEEIENKIAPLALA